MRASVDGQAAGFRLHVDVDQDVPPPETEVDVTVFQAELGHLEPWRERKRRYQPVPLSDDLAGIVLERLAAPVLTLDHGEVAQVGELGGCRQVEQERMPLELMEQAGTQFLLRAAGVAGERVDECFGLGG
jgi:hypothetical protein